MMALAVAALFALAAPPAQAVDSVYGLTTTNRLVGFQSNAPGTLTTNVAISGLQVGESLLAIDFRPATGQLYAIGDTSRMYTVDPATGVATQIGGVFVPALAGTRFGFDFSAAADRARIVSDADQNMRLNPNTGAVAGVDTNLDYPASDPNDAANPRITALGITNSAAGATSTTVYAIDSDLDILARLGSVDGSPFSPNAGLLFTVGSLGVNTSDLSGLDIVPGTGVAAAVLTSGGVQGYWTISLASGAATFVGNIGNAGGSVQDLAVDNRGGVQMAAASTAVAENAGSVALTVNRSGMSLVPIAQVNFTTGGGNAVAGFDYATTSGTLAFNAGEISKTITVPVTDDALDNGNRTFDVSLSGATGAMLAAPATTTVTILDDEPPDVVKPDVKVSVKRGLRVTATCSEACTFSARLLGGSRGRTVLGKRTASTPAAGDADFTVKLGSRGKRSLRRARKPTLKLRLTGTDAAGNKTTVDKTVSLKR
jgi:hypothetical protein